MIYLEASCDVLLDRIETRNNEYESTITADYLQALVEAYNKYFFYYNDTPLLVVNTSEIDFVNNPSGP